MSFPAKRFGVLRLLAASLLLSAASVQARDLTFDRWKGEAPEPEAGARILVVYRIEEKDLPVWSRMPRRPYRVLGVLRSFETVGLSHQPLYRLAQEASRRGGDAIVLLAPRNLPGSWIRGDDVGVTIHGQNFTVLVLCASTGVLSLKPLRSLSGAGKASFLLCHDPS
ncbi:hypothetical protein [Methylacidimicrobium tartarophylax]|uniref:YfiR family protein n=1 Tax=Methylacidimicrobium tartarophylax TaxID=1041768 RepID=A0A5E6MI75_9BACT|nr:hypothetical protein [Methylacidimicrobium tartarophylax]VVM07933.1 hypothetical protein MAMT_02016 [Methylacidimicrobium tartarophylax]